MVVDRTTKVPISHHGTIEGAGSKIVKELAFNRWTVMAQDALRPGSNMRALTRHEKLRLEKTLYPLLFD